MKFKFINAHVAAVGLALMLIDAGSSQAAIVTLSGTSNSCTYTSFSANASGDIAVTCASVNTPPTAIPVCTPTATVNPVASGSPTTLNANCTNGPITTYAWTTVPPTISISTASSVIVNPTVATTYSVIANNGVGDSVASQVTVTISVAPSPPPPSTGLLSKADWVKAFSTLNNIPLSRSTVDYLYEYFVVLYQAKPSAFILPGGTLQTL